MFKIGPHPAVHDTDTMATARRVMPSTVGHMQDRGFAFGLNPLTPTKHLVGTAYTVRIGDLDSSAVHYAVDHIEPGHVVVIDMGGDVERACVGAMVAFTAKERGAAGIIVDGMATDLVDLIEFDLPVFARGTSALTTRVLGLEGDVNVPVSIAGATAVPGQLVLGDSDGVLFITAPDLLALADHAIDKQDWEAEVKQKVRAGTPLSQLSGAADRMADRMVQVP
ncbi:RraA family protein [Streptomyces sp. OE57]|uniref:RraA family protein n=1 Tax=Streptomyces lacaronensis TaxID=3379885 RepID=UPI0039B77D31